MNKKAILYNDFDDLLFELSKSKLVHHTKIDCSSISINELLSYNNPSLFKRNSFVFYNAQDIKQQDLLKILDSINDENILAFMNVDKRTKVYKKLVDEFELICCQSLTTNIIKKDFIKTELVENKLDLKLLEYFFDILPENKMIISKEIKKFADIIDLTSNIKLAKQSMMLYKANSDIFELINAIFDRSITRFYLYMNKVLLDTNPLHINAILSKKILYMIYLSIGESSKAKEFFNTRDYFLKKDMSLAKNIGFNSLLNFYTFCDDILGDIYLEKSMPLRLLSIYQYFNRNSIN